MRAYYIFLFLLCVTVFGCKRNTCEGVVCPYVNQTCVDGTCQVIDNNPCAQNQHLENGFCVCDTGWFGLNCDVPAPDCGPHGHTVANYCVCDSGWAGDNCEVNLGMYVGLYHFTGTSQTSLGGAPPQPTIYTDDTSSVFLRGDTLVAREYKFLYGKGVNGQDTSRYRIFGFLPPYSSGANYGSIKVNKTNSDTLYYYTHLGSPSGGTGTHLIGVKL